MCVCVCVSERVNWGTWMALLFCPLTVNLHSVRVCVCVTSAVALYSVSLVLRFQAAWLLHTHTLNPIYPCGKLQLAWRSSHSGWLIDFRFLSSSCDERRLLGDRQGAHTHTHTHTHNYILVRTSYRRSPSLNRRGRLPCFTHTHSR